ncbi:MAG: O-methyltransferase [Saprospiraceae bacterium]|nr:O-methyltransferase [Saprospiraceae bacterium]MBK8671205.1 O-methyltransferase [Saprospiraceae bacterium]MBL0101694.1 O-methyltransferase [Saprospiraceae bacterium]
MQDILPKLYEYCDQHSTLFDPILPEIERATHLLTLSPRMISGHLQGSLLAMISKIISPECILEIGTFTGYSAICLAQGLRTGGHLITIEYDKENAAIASDFFEKSSFCESIRLYTGDAKNIIPDLNETFDLIFIDADKEAYATYYDMVIDKCRSGALILVDNVLWSGKVILEKKDKKTRWIDDFNQKISSDSRVESLILPIRDGINVIRKK